MKAKLLITLLAVATALTACKKNEKKEVYYCCYIPSNIYMAAFMADTSWRTDHVLLSNVKDSLVILAKKDNENLKLGIKYIDTGKYAVTPQNVVFSKTSGNNLVSEYRPAAGSSNYIRIVYYDKKRRLMQGEFKLELIKNARYTGAGLADTISFVRGGFRVAIPE